MDYVVILQRNKYDSEESKTQKFKAAKIQRNAFKALILHMLVTRSKEFEKEKTSLKHFKVSARLKRPGTVFENA